MFKDCDMYDSISVIIRNLWCKVRYVAINERLRAIIVICYNYVLSRSKGTLFDVVENTSHRGYWITLAWLVLSPVK